MADKYTAYFEKYIGRALYRWERDIIAPLEYIRQHTANHRVVIVDPPGYDSRQLLCQYFRFLHECIAPEADFLIMARTRIEARRLCNNTTPARSPWLSMASVRQPDSIRGLTFHFALLLDTTTNHIEDALAAVAPIILNEGRDNFIIIHTRSASLLAPPAYIRDPKAPRPRIPDRPQAPCVMLIESGPPPDTPTQENPDPAIPVLRLKVRTMR